MPKPSTNTKIPKSPEQLAAEAAGREVLRQFCNRRGAQAAICRKTDLTPAVLCRILKGQRHANLETAVLIEVATDGAVPADVLCPSRAAVLQTMMNLRAAQ